MLTAREAEIARLVAQRRSNKAIGRALEISPRTVPAVTFAAMTRRLAVAVALLLVACRADAPPPPEREPTWPDESADPAAATARQLRGLDVAMLELDHRFVELYFAGQDRNWPYAQYQAQKLKLVMELALVGRPNRAAAANALFFPALQQIDSAAHAADAAAFATAFVRLHTACNSCHVAERVPTFHVDMPRARRSTITTPMNP